MKPVCLFMDGKSPLNNRKQAYIMRRIELKESIGMKRVSWFVTAQLQNKALVEIHEQSGKGLAVSCASRWPESQNICIAQGSGRKTVSEELVLDLSIKSYTTDREIEFAIAERSKVITDIHSGLPLAAIYLFNVEDSTDNDYNDVCINIVVWKD